MGVNVFANCPGLTGSVQLILNQNYPESSEVDIATLTEEQKIISAELLKGLDGLQGELIIPKYITKIEESAFENCKGITSLTFEGTDDGTSSLAEIGKNAFYNCISIQNNIIFPSNLKTIGESAFYSSGITGISLNEGLTNIGTKCFGYCTALSGTVTIPYTLSETGAYSFYYSNIETLNFQTKTVNGEVVGCKTVSDYSFQSCLNLTSMTFPNTLKVINEGGFYSVGIRKTILISFPDSLEKIEAKAFRGGQKLDILHWSTNLKIIGDYACYQGYMITSLPDCTSLETIEDYAFQSCSNIRKSGETETNIIEWIKNAPNLKYIGANAFKDISSISKITLPSSLSSLGDESFKRCKATNYIFQGNKLTSFPKSCFDNSDIISMNSTDNTINIPTGITEIASSCFGYSSGITKVIFPSTLTKLYGSAFYDVPLTELSFPEGLTSIGNSAFGAEGRPGTFTSLKIPNSVTSIGKECFKGRTSIQTVEFSSGMSVVPEGCFNSCSALSKITFNSTITSFGDSCFENCTQLATILDKSKTSSIFNWGYVVYVGNSSFLNCTSLNGDYTINRQGTIAENAYDGCTNFVLHK